MTEQFITSDGAKLWTISQGEGIPLMLCNGGPGCCDYLAPVAAMVDDLARVLRFEQRGCGRSEAIPPYDVETCLGDLDTIREQYGIERWIIGGHSWGADLALFYALRYPARVAGLICLAGGRIHNDREWHKEYERRKKQEGEALPPFEYPPNLEVNRQVNESWKRYVQASALLKEIAELQVPALFVYGDQDIRPSWPVEQVARLLPRGRFELIQGAPHVLWLTHPEELERHLRGFVESIAFQRFTPASRGDDPPGGIV